MTQTTANSPPPWPPPPDRASLRELLATADIEGFIADDGAPIDEYDTEADLLFDQLQLQGTADLVTPRLLPALEAIWRGSFSLSDPDLAQRRPALTALASQIERFFGPQATPQVRGS